MTRSLAFFQRTLLHQDTKFSFSIERKKSSLDAGFFFVEMAHLNFKVWLNFGLDTDPARARGSVKVFGIFF